MADRRSNAFGLWLLDHASSDPLTPLYNYHAIPYTYVLAPPLFLIVIRRDADDVILDHFAIKQRSLPHRLPPPISSDRYSTAPSNALRCMIGASQLRRCVGRLVLSDNAQLILEQECADDRDIERISFTPTADGKTCTVNIAIIRRRKLDALDEWTDEKQIINVKRICKRTKNLQIDANNAETPTKVRTPPTVTPTPTTPAPAPAPVPSPSPTPIPTPIPTTPAKALITLAPTATPEASEPAPEPIQQHDELEEKLASPLLSESKEQAEVGQVDPPPVKSAELLPEPGAPVSLEPLAPSEAVSLPTALSLWYPTVDRNSQSVRATVEYADDKSRMMIVDVLIAVVAVVLTVVYIDSLQT